MKILNTHRLRYIIAGLLAASFCLTQHVSAASDTWTGSGSEDTWTNALNWGVVAPSSGDFLAWGSGATTSSNNFPAGTIFGNIAFNKGAASFTLVGNRILLTNLYDIAGGLVLSPGTAYGSISNNSASAQFVNLPVEFMNGYHYIVTTNGNLNIGGTMTRDTGAVITFYTNGSGNINLTGAGLATNNFNNLLGGWAVLNNTRWATLDVNSNVVAFSNFTTNYNTGTGIDTITNGPSLNYQTWGGSPAVASGGATINSLQIFSTNRPTGNVTAGTISFANGTDILRLSQNGGIMLANSYNSANNNGGNWIIGASAGSGIITAGTNGNSELFFCEANDVSSAGGSLTVNSVITDNGSGKVTVVKNGGQNLSFGAANNTYSGGTYINQSRIAPTTVGAMGYGPIFVNNGAQLWARANITFTNDVYLSGSGNGESQQFGALRLNGSASCVLSGTIHVNVATPKISNSGTLSGKITGGAGMRFSSAHASGTSPTVISIGNTGNNYAGDTFIWADGFNTFLRMSNSLVIPNGPGTGNLILTNNSGHNAYLDLNGFNEAVNGLISAPGTGGNDFVTNNNGSIVSMLTIGGNNATATFAGCIGVGNGQVALTKIGAGTETLTGTNKYSGATYINGGTLTLSGSGYISNSANVYLNGGTLDISGLAGSSTTLQPLSMTNAALTVVLNPSVTNITTTTLTTGGTNNFINITGVTGLSGAAYPTNFTLIKYSQFVSNSFFTFGTLVASTIQGYITNTGSAIVVVLTNGPKPILWKGLDSINPTFWDIATTTNWQFNGLSAVPFNTADSVTFDDTAVTFNVNVTTSVSPGSVTVNNTANNYTFGGAGNIGGNGALTKQGSGSLTLQESGDSFSGGVNVAGGSIKFIGNNAVSGGTTIAGGTTVQVGNNTGTGMLPSGNVINNGSLLFDVGTNLSVPGSISGSGSITNEAAGILNLGGVNTFTGRLAVQQGTLQMGDPAALGAPTNGALFSSGATLDVNGFSAGSVNVYIGGSGVGNNGAIINSGSAIQTALQYVILTGDTTFGGTARWDIRSANISDPSQGSLSTGGFAYNLTKSGINQVSLVGITIDPALANIDVQQGTLSIESATSGLGSPSGTLTVESGATLQLNQLTSYLDKNFTFNGNGVADTIYALGSTSSSQNTIQPSSGSVTLNGACIFDCAPGIVLNIGANNPIIGSGSLTEVGAGTFTLTANSSYSGNTAINGGTFVLDGNNSGGGTLNVASGTILAGTGGNTGPAIVAGNLVPGYSIPPGGDNQVGTFSTGPLTLTNATLTVDLQNGGGDLIAVNGNLTLSGTNSIQPMPVIGNISSGQQLTIITYTGSLNGTTNNFVLLPAAQPGYAFSLVDPATTPGAIEINVDHVPANKLWQGGASSAPNVWDINITTNWYNEDNSSNGTVFTAGDTAYFDDTATTNLVNLVGSIDTINVIMNNSSLNYTFTGNGNLTGIGGLTLNGGGTLFLANSGTNNLAGPIYIYAGSLVVGNGSTNGTVGSGAITNYSNLSFDRSDAFTVPNNIAGSGSISNLGPGVVTLSGNNNSFNGADYLIQGTLRAANSTALGNINGTTVTIFSNATLDVTGNSVNLGNLAINVIGTGVSNNGAIVNNGLNTITGTNLANVTMQGDTTFGGTGRLDLRSPVVGVNTANLYTSGQPYNLTKTGTNQFWISGVNVDGALGNIIITNGLLGIEAGTTLGDPSYTLTVCTNATLNFYNLSNVLSKNLVLNDGSTVASTSGSNVFGGAIALTGTDTFNVSSGALALGSDGFSGSAGTFVKSGSAILFLYSIPTGSVFDLTGGTLDVGNAGGALNLGTGQTIRGSATLSGNLTVGSGSTVSPSETSSIGTLTVTNGTVMLGGTALFKLNHTANDVLSCAGGIQLGGTLMVTNINNGILQNGDSFSLFQGPLSGTITPSLPPLWPGLSWSTTNLNSQGVIGVVGSIIPPKFTTTRFSAGGFVVSGSGGLTGANCSILTSTNVALPLSQWTTYTNSVFDGSGNCSFTNSVSGSGQQFYVISVPVD